MDWRDIPSLLALRAFEAAARLGSYSEAARELNVTHAAIAQHVRGLEAHFGQSLMARDGRGMRPSPEGRRFAEDLGAGFAEIAAGVRRLDQTRSDAPLAVTATVTLAENWLMPRLFQFWRERPDIPVTISAENRVVDLRRDGFDMAIRFGNGKWPGLEADLILRRRTVVVAHPDVAAQLPEEFHWAHPDAPKMLSKLDWITDSASREIEMSLRARGIDWDNLCKTEVSGTNLVLAACRAGAGASGQSLAVVEKDIESGALVCLLEECEAQNSGYFIVTEPGMKSERLRTFIKWLKAEAESV